MIFYFQAEDGRRDKLVTGVQTCALPILLGEVSSAGQYPFVAGMTVNTAVAIAGGYTHRANTNVARVTRNLGDRIVELGVETSAAIRPGDTILIRERYF